MPSVQQEAMPATIFSIIIAIDCTYNVSVTLYLHSTPLLLITDLTLTATLKNETIWIDGGLQSFAQWQDNNSLLSYTATAPTFNATSTIL